MNKLNRTLTIAVKLNRARAQTLRFASTPNLNLAKSRPISWSNWKSERWVWCS
ncbi:hypothetical protein RHMOL_Rhmol05G0285600 [Rhododendron molle]|uniref:Uncharacterized protein n=1 Tax=Rhododendron molle TaxID=49168 RepID=A0ACC0NU73_RHOML|nr:hypothetical protein RHMOL_Rhmol05G0285600 [Rhododendron molle]